MNLKLDLLKASAQVFGAPLYKETQNFGTVAPGEYELQAEYNSVKIFIDAEKTEFISARLRQDKIDAGINPEVDTLTIAEFTAQRDAEGDFNDKAWKVVAGSTRIFAY